MKNNTISFVTCFLACLCANSCHDNQKDYIKSFLCWYGETFSMEWYPELKKEVCDG